MMMSPQQAKGIAPRNIETVPSQAGPWLLGPDEVAGSPWPASAIAV